MFGRFIIGGSPAPIFNATLSALAVGPMSAASFLTATGLTIARSTVSTVQTSASTLDATPAVNDACIGDRATGSRGLVVQQNTNQLVGGSGNNAPRAMNVTWSAGTATTTTAQNASPNVDGATPGVGCTRVNATSGQYSNFGDSLSSARRCFTSWQRSKDSATNGGMQMGWVLVTPGGVGSTQVVRAATNVWGRMEIAGLGTNREYFAVCDGRDYSGSGGETARARDVYVDYIQLEAGDWSSEAIPIGGGGVGGRRSGEVLSYANGAALIAANNQVKFYGKLIPKFSSSMQVFYDGGGGAGASAAWYLWSWGANGQNYAKIKDSDKKLYVKIANGTEAVSTNAIAFTRYDVLEVYVAAGGSVASVARYRLNGGAWVDLVLGTMTDTPAPGANPLGLFYNDFGTATADRGQFPAWVQQISFYGASGAP